MELNPKFECDVCGAVFRTNQKLTIHFRLHASQQFKSEPTSLKKPEDNFQKLPKHDEKPFTCELCGNSYGNYRNMKRHQRIHTGKPYKCAECGKAFNHSVALKDHERIHSGEKPYKCEECGKTFGRNWYLVSHLRTHNPQSRPKFKCDICGNEFVSDFNLRLHLKTHVQSPDRPFSCKECKSYFKRQSDLKAHLKKHAEEARFQCKSNRRTLRTSKSGGQHKSTSKVAVDNHQIDVEMTIKVEPEDLLSL